MRRACRSAGHLAIIAASVVATLSLGCVYRTVHVHEHARRSEPVYAKENGPPPWAPAHGYRRKHGDHHHHHGVEIRFDTDLGIYVVVGYPGHYFDGEHYFRLAGDVWQLSVELNRGWAPARSRQLPPGLAKLSPGKQKAKGKGKHDRSVPASRAR